MKYFVKQKALTFFKNQYEIRDENQNLIFYVKSTITIPYKLTFYNEKDEKVLLIKKRYFRPLKRYDIKVDNKPVVILKKRLSVLQKRFKTKSSIDALNNIKIQGDILGFSFQFTKNEALVASVGKKFLTIGDRYSIDIIDKENNNIYLAIAIIIDDIVHKKRRVN